MHLRVPLSPRILRRTRRIDDRRIHDRPASTRIPRPEVLVHPRPAPRSCCSSRWRNLHTVVSSGTGSFPEINARKLAHHHRVIKRFLYCLGPKGLNKCAASAPLPTGCRRLPAFGYAGRHACSISSKNAPRPPRLLAVPLESIGHRQCPLLHVSPIPPPALIPTLRRGNWRTYFRSRPIKYFRIHAKPLG